MRLVSLGLGAAAVLALTGLLAPESAVACSVCIDPNEDSRTAFNITAVALSLLPMVMVGGLVFWLRREQRRRAVLIDAPGI